MVVVSLFFNFLIELTAMAPETRIKVFRQELSKVFMSVVVFFFLTVFLTTWVFSLASSINANLTWKENDRIAQRKHYDKRISLLKR